MTISTTVNKFRYEGNGVTDTFAYSARIFSASDIVVEIITRATDALEETLTLGTDYAITILSPESASVQVTNALKIPSSLQDIQLRRVTPSTQTVDLPTGTVFPAVIVENAIDKAVALIQDKSEEIARALKLPPQSSVSSATLPNPVADSLLAWDGTDGDIKNVAVASLDASLDVLLSSVMEGDYLKYTGGLWQNVDITTLAGEVETELGLGTLATQNADDVAITGGTISGLDTDLAIADGGTGASTAANARSNLGLAYATVIANTDIIGGVITANGSTPNTVLDVAAIRCWASAQDFVLTTGSTTEVDITDSADGNDGGSIGATDSVYLYVVGDTSGSNATTVKWSDTRSPTFTGYDRMRYIGSRRTDGSSNLIAMTQDGDTVRYDSVQTAYNSTVGTTAANYPVLTPADARVKSLTTIILERGGGGSVAGWIYEKGTTVPAPSSTGLSANISSQAGNRPSGNMEIMSSDGEVAAIAEVALNMRIFSLGWEDFDRKRFV